MPSTRWTSALDPELVAEVLEVIPSSPRRDDDDHRHTRRVIARDMPDRVCFSTPDDSGTGTPAEIFSGHAKSGRSSSQHHRGEADVSQTLPYRGTGRGAPAARALLIFAQSLA